MQRFYGIGLRAISLNTFFQLTARLVGSTTNLLITIIIASFMGYSTIGSFIKVTEFVLVFNLIIDFGLNPVFQRIYKDNIDKKLGNLIILRLIISLLLIPVIFFISNFLPEITGSGGGYSQVEKFGILIFSLTLTSFAVYHTFLGFLQFKLSNKLSIPASLLSSATALSIIYFASLNKSFPLLFLAFVISGIIYTFVLYLTIKKFFKIKIFVTNLIKFSIPLIKQSWPLGTVFFINYFYARLDIFILSLLRPTVDVGVYGISYRFFDVAIAVPTFLAASTYPLLIKVLDQPKVYITHFKKYLFFYGIISLAGTIILVVLSPIIQILRSEFLLSVLPLQILALSLPFFFFTSLLQWHFVIRKKILLLVPIYVVVLLLNLILNLIFVPHFSYLASAVITGVCEGIVFAFLLFFFLKHRLA